MGRVVVTAGKGGLVDDHVDHHGHVGGITAGAIGVSAGAAHSVETLGQCTGRPPRGSWLVCVCVRVESLGGAAAPDLDHLGGPVKVETAADAAGYLDQDIRWMRGQLHAGKL